MNENFASWDHTKRLGEIYEFAANCFGKLLTLIIYLTPMITIYSEERLIQWSKWDEFSIYKKQNTID